MSDAGHRAEISAATPVGHEPSDVDIGSLAQFAAALAVFTAIVFLAVWGLFAYFDARETDLQRSQLPLAAAERGRRPPAPRLEGMNLEYGKARARLDSLRPPAMTQVQNDAVSKAMTALENQLPVRAEPRPLARPPGDSNSGRGAAREVR